MFLNVVLAVWTKLGVITGIWNVETEILLRSHNPYTFDTHQSGVAVPPMRVRYDGRNSIQKNLTLVAFGDYLVTMVTSMKPQQLRLNLQQSFKSHRTA